MTNSLNRAIFTYRIICAGLIAGILFSIPLWLSDRLLPLVPVYKQINILPAPFDKILLGILLLSLLFGLIGKYIRQTTILTSIILILFVLSDQLRWQPWVYQFGLMLIPFIFLSTETRAKTLINIQMLLIISIYLWTGIHKLQPQFILYVSNPIFKNLFYFNKDFINNVKELGYLIPFFEILTGLLLIYFKTRKAGFFLLLFSHLFILYYLSPLGINFNSVVWPWNASMILFGSILFYNNTDLVINFDIIKKNILLYIFFGFVCVLMPLLGIKKKWDHYLSFNIYSGNPNELALIIPENVNKIPIKLSEYIVDGVLVNENKVLNLNRWCMFELNVPIPPQQRIYTNLAQQVSTKYNFEGILLIRELKNGNIIMNRKAFTKAGKTLP